MMALGIILYALFAVVDSFATHEYLNEILVIRLLFVSPILTLLLFIQFKARKAVLMKIVNFFYVLTAGLSIVFIGGLVDVGSLAYYTYFGGLMLVVTWCNAMFLPPPHSVYVSILLFGAYNAMMLWRNIPQTDANFFYVSNSFLLTSCIITVYNNISLAKRILKYHHKKTVIDTMNEELRSLVHMRRKLFSILAHDIRGPISNLASLISLKRSYGMGEEEYGKYERSIMLTIEGIVEILDNTNRWSKYVQENGEMPREVFCLKELVETVIGYYKIPAQMKNVNLRVQVEGCRVQGCKPILEMAIRNLVSNAIKFTDGGADVELVSDCNYDANLCTLSVIDAGIGMNDDQIRIMNSGLTCVDSSMGTAHEKGFGLGIILSQDMLSRVGGSIAYVRNSGVGITAHLRFPIAI